MKASRRMGFDATVALTDATGNLRAFPACGRCAILHRGGRRQQGLDRCLLRNSTHVWNDYIADPKLAPLANIQKLMAVGGGLPLFHDGKLIGGIGVSGGRIIWSKV